MMGFGDFIRGNVSCMQIAKQERFDFEFDLGAYAPYFAYPLRHIETNQAPTDFRNPGKWGDFSTKLLRHVGNKWSNVNNKDFAIFTNAYPRIEKQTRTWGNIDPSIAQYIATRLTPSTKLLAHYTPLPFDYEVIHVRGGDKIAFNKSHEWKHKDVPYEQLFQHTLYRINQVKAGTTNKIVLLSDCQRLKQDVKQAIDGIIISQSVPDHAGSKVSLGVLLDMLTLCDSKRIYQLSVYPWGSGFSSVAHHIFNVPLVQYPQIEKDKPIGKEIYVPNNK